MTINQAANEIATLAAGRFKISQAEAKELVALCLTKEVIADHILDWISFELECRQQDISSGSDD